MFLALEGAKNGALDFTQGLVEKIVYEHSGGEPQEQGIYSTLQQWQQSPGGWAKCQSAACVCRHTDPVFLPSVELQDCSQRQLLGRGWEALVPPL